MKPVVKIAWMESERGWGQRPDGHSLHLNQADANQYIKEYWDSMPDRVNGQAPEVYSAPDFDGTIKDVDDEMYAKIEESKNGVRIY